jgi:hypothetical protein
MKHVAPALPALKIFVPRTSHTSLSRRVCFASAAIVVITWRMLPCLVLAEVRTKHDGWISLVRAPHKLLAADCTTASADVGYLAAWRVCSEFLHVTLSISFYLHSDYLTPLCCQQPRGLLSFLSVVLLFSSPLLLQLLEHRMSRRLSPLDPHDTQNQNLSQSTFLQLPTLQQVPRALQYLMSLSL